MKRIIALFSFLCLVSVFSADAQIPLITESSEPSEDIYIDGVVKKTMMVENKVLPYETLREGDIPWEKRIWRIIDIREKRNQPFAYPVKPFFTILQESVSSGEIIPFREDDFSSMMELSDLEGLMSTTDTAEVYDPDTYETSIEITTSEINPEDIKRFRMKEIWFFDKESSVMKVRILGIAPIREFYDETTGAFKYQAPLFWIYYPEARKVLAKHRAFNPFNDAAPLTWYDIFESRQFSSYIIKKSNALDLRLEDKYPENGLEQLMEAEKIKAELFNFEHDLWSY